MGVDRWRVCDRNPPNYSARLVAHSFNTGCPRPDANATLLQQGSDFVTSDAVIKTMTNPVRFVPSTVDRLLPRQIQRYWRRLSREPWRNDIKLMD